MAYLLRAMYMELLQVLSNTLLEDTSTARAVCKVAIRLQLK